MSRHLCLFLSAVLCRLTDWATTTPPFFGNKVVATTSYRNTPTGSQTRTVRVYNADVALITRKSVKSAISS
jgi:hypothetical protein